MNRKKIFSMVGSLLCLESLLMVPAIACSLLYREYGAAHALFIAAMLALLVGLTIRRTCKPITDVIYAREGYIMVSLSWLLLSLFGALPFVLSNEIPSYVDAFFETVSGFTTTGASILDHVEDMSHGLLFWRCFTHWVGGMGILVFAMAFIPGTNDHSIHIMRAEMPGPVVGKLVPRARDTAKILYGIYFCLTMLQVILLRIGKMPLFDCLVHAFGTVGTGGFGIRSDSIGGYSPYLQWVITIFMFLSGVNFNIYYLLIVRRYRDVKHSSEFVYYLSIILVSTLAISINLVGYYPTAGETIRHAAFQTTSVITTTGFSTVDFNLWPSFSKAILLILMICGACAGSTGGGLKVSRAVILMKMIGREMKHLLHPRSINSVTFESKQVDSETQKSVSNYFAIYIICMIFVFLLLSLEPLDLETNLTATISCFNNIGPAFSLAGPAASYSFYPPLCKLLLAFAMLFGRLEILPMLLTFQPTTWTRDG